jgi:hypothetical protein
MLRRAGFLVLLAIFVALPATSQGEFKYNLTVAPASTPTPPLKFQLLPDPRDAVPGNSAALYYRTEAMFVENSFLLKDIRETRWSEWPSMPLKDLPLAEVEKSVGMWRNFIRELDHAAHQRDCDWNLAGREEGIALLIPDVQGFRMFANVLAVKARLHIARGQYPEAIKAIQTGYALGRNLGKGPTLIHMLVGVAIVAIMDNQLDTLMQQPDAPNLYWALRTLPRPMFDIKPALLEESQWLERMWPFLTRVEKGVLSADEIQEGMQQLEDKVKTFNLREPALKNAIRSAAIVSLHGPAKTWLVDNGFRKETVEAMNPVQAVTLYVYKRYRTAYDDWLVWALAGETEATHPGMKAARDKVIETGKMLDRLYFGGLLGGLSDGVFVAPLDKLSNALHRTERRHAGFAIIEALRLHALKNNGKWPDSLDDVKVVPIPKDPITGKPWEFKHDGEWVTLISPLAPGEKPSSYAHFIFRVGIREK